MKDCKRLHFTGINVVTERSKGGIMAYVIAVLLLVGFVANVILGAISGSAPLNVVTEMLILLCAATAFSVGILQSEAREKSKNKTE